MGAMCFNRLQSVAQNAFQLGQYGLAAGLGSTKMTDRCVKTEL